VYYEFKENVPLPIGLIPGAVVTFNSLKLKTSKSGNSYCTNTEVSSVAVNELSDVELARMSGGGTECSLAAAEMFTLPVSYLSELMASLVGHSLQKSVVCIRVSHVTVHRLCAVYKCQGCHCVISGGRCTAACSRKRPMLEVTAR